MKNLLAAKSRLLSARMLAGLEASVLAAAAFADCV